MVGSDHSRSETASGATERVLEGLVEDLAPVRRIPSLRVVLGGIATLWGAAVVVRWTTGAGTRPDTWTLLRTEPGFALIFVGLLVLASGALLLAAAASVPGREPTARIGRWLAWSGALLGCVVAPTWVLLHAAGGSIWPQQEDLYCVRGALRVAILPALAAVGFVFWAAPRRPAWIALLGVLGAAALGAVAVHTACPVEGARHWILGHALAPLQIAVVLAVPLALLARWYANRSRE